MTDSAISISPSLLSDISPFYLAINSKRKLVHVGRMIRQICSGLNQESVFEEYFDIQRPTEILDLDSIQTYVQTLVVIQIRCAPLLLKGQMFYLPESDILLFVGSPLLTDLNAIASAGLALTDFAIHDPIVDYLALLQTQRSSLIETRTLVHHSEQRNEVRNLVERDRELNDLKSRFITTASHGFRTPLGIIASSAGILQDYASQIDDVMRQKHLSRIQSAVSRINDLLSDVLTVSHMEAGTVQVHPHPLKLDACCQKLVEDCQGMTSSTLTYTIAPELLNQVVVLDEELFTQLLSNLLSNAIKYTPESGHVVVEVKRDLKKLVLTIQDSGIGIPPEDLTSIFDPFYRASNVGNIAGTGLGLAIAKYCTDLHHGTLAIASTVGVGTIVTVTLPLQSTDGLSEGETDACVMVSISTD